jgi:bifunctional DNA-binding transcriptional regulator/antitoxin component of YhaV-PrlF toxin-antitoxin module
MESRSTVWAEVNEQGQLVLPAEVAARYGLLPGARVRLDTGPNDVRLHRPVSHLAKVYVEPTNLCNIVCRTCMRNNWDDRWAAWRRRRSRACSSLAGIGRARRVLRRLATLVPSAHADRGRASQGGRRDRGTVTSTLLTETGAS